MFHTRWWCEPCDVKFIYNQVQSLVNSCHGKGEWAIIKRKATCSWLVSSRFTRIQLWTTLCNKVHNVGSIADPPLHPISQPTFFLGRKCPLVLRGHQLLCQMPQNRLQNIAPFCIYVPSFIYKYRSPTWKVHIVRECNLPPPPSPFIEYNLCMSLYVTWYVSILCQFLGVCEGLLCWCMTLLVPCSLRSTQ